MKNTKHYAFVFFVFFLFSCSNINNKKEKLYRITIQEAENGKVTTEKIEGITAGEEIVLSVTTDEAYELKDLKIVKQNNKDVALVSIKKGVSYKFSMPNSDVTLDDLLSAFQKFLERKKLEQPLHTKITKKEMSVEERSVSIRNILKTKKKVNFLELFDVLNKEYVVVTFLAILEMAKQNELKITQEEEYGEIICEVTKWIDM